MYILNFLCENTIFYFEITEYMDDIGKTPYTVYTYFPGRCRPLPEFNPGREKTIRMQYFLGVGEES